MAPFRSQRLKKILFASGLALLCGASGPSSARAIPEDPITVFFDKTCSSQVLEIQIWNRIEKRWSHHPEHPRILSGSCQVEDAGYLMNEIRVRCLRTDKRTIDPWQAGIKVYEPGVVDKCILPSARIPIVEINTPKRGEVVQNETRLVRIEGRTVFESIQQLVPRNEVAERLLEAITLSQPEVREVRVQNLTENEPAMEVNFEPGGRFSALVGLRTGENLIRVTVVDENEKVGDITLPVVFDITQLREKWLRAERERIQKFREKQREGQVDIDVVDP
jgi:hypothetical protein